MMPDSTPMAQLFLSHTSLRPSRIPAIIRCFFYLV